MTKTEIREIRLMKYRIMGCCFVCLTPSPSLSLSSFFLYFNSCSSTFSSQRFLAIYDFRR